MKTFHARFLIIIANFLAKIKAYWLLTTAFLMHVQNKSTQIIASIVFIDARLWTGKCIKK